ncbi:MAG TPA: DEAD/DEAH box helicase [Erysipelotrichaceae bacterium]|nr:DEAD/DEAH box helicase [Erysipelotrichaceae bacterium]
MSNFPNLLSEKTRRFIALNNFKELSVIQSEVLPYALKARDVIGISKTGTGKTHAYLIPLMQKIDPNRNEVQALIIAPTRELAQQIFEFAKPMMEVDSQIRVKLITGGTDKKRTTEKLGRQPHIVIGTVGKVRELFVEDSLLRIDQADILVVDEADMILEIGYLEDLDIIAAKMKERLQMLLFSATIPDNLRPFMKKYMHNPHIVQVKEDEKFNPRITHVLVPIKHRTHLEATVLLAKSINPLICLVVCNTRTDAVKLADLFRENNLRFVELRGDMSARARKQTMSLIGNDEARFIIATDVAARGIDIPEISHVISVGLPKDIDFYIHRAGRTGRTGREGTCYVLYGEKDDASIRILMKKHIKFEHMANNETGLRPMKPYGEEFVRKSKPQDIEISKLVNRRVEQVKPGYKKKRAAEVESIKRKRRRQMIQDSIKVQSKTKAKMKQIEINNEKAGGQ